jgi:hypothetical protein
VEAVKARAYPILVLAQVLVVKHWQSRICKDTKTWVRSEMGNVIPEWHTEKLSRIWSSLNQY